MNTPRHLWHQCDTRGVVVWQYCQLTLADGRPRINQCAGCIGEVRFANLLST